MPFTFAHPSFAFPLRYVRPRWFSVTGLVLGSMAPDFEYFLALEPHRTIGHSLTGFFLQVVPLCILIAYLYHAVVKRPLVLHLPSVLGLNRRAYGMLNDWSLRTLRDWGVFLSSVFIGFLSHLALDAFTHEGGRMVRQFAVLRATVAFDYPVYKLLQHGLSLIGLAVAAATIGMALYRSSPARETPIVSGGRKLIYWGIAASVAILMTACKLLMTAGGNVVGMLVVAPITGFCAGLLVASLLRRR